MDVEFSSKIITAKNLVNSIIYVYDAEGNMTRKRIIDGDGNEQTVYYENAEDTNTVTRFTVPDPTESDPDKTRTVTSHSKTDSFGRKVFDELQLGTGFVSRQFSYHAGSIPDEHKDNEKIKSTATTQLVSQIVLSDERTISYEYDEEERITKVIDSVDGTTEYTYDALGQLLTETVIKDGVSTVVNSMEYDNCGNIKTKNGIAYGYASAWKDLLTSYNGQSIIYDAQGNPTNYLGHTLTWEKGRQLKSFDDNIYTYNANGIRTSKTVGGVKHNYVLDGTKILRECWNYDEAAKIYKDILILLYDNEDSVCGIVYNNTPYYFLKNQQGDVIAITDANGDTVARYTYDAWGVCTVALDMSTCGIASINPYRYRGYYYDTEIGLYYLQSRYYNPVVGRFINADDIVIVLNLNITYNSLFIYCSNNPVDYSDYQGYGQMVIKAIPTCPYEIRKAITDSQLHYKRGSVFNQKNAFFLNSKDIGNGFMICSFYQYKNGGSMKETSDYLVGAMTRTQWYNYLENKTKDELSFFMQGLNEAMGMMIPGPPDKMVIASFLIEQLLSLDSLKHYYIKQMLKRDLKNHPPKTSKSKCGVITSTSNRLVYIALSVHSETQIFRTNLWKWDFTPRWHPHRSEDHNAWW